MMYNTCCCWQFVLSARLPIYTCTHVRVRVCVCVYCAAVHIISGKSIYVIHGLTRIAPSRHTPSLYQALRQAASQLCHCLH